MPILPPYVGEVSEHQFDQGGFAAARCAHYRRDLALRYFERDVAEGVVKGVRVIFEAEVVKSDGAVTFGHFAYPAVGAF